MVPSEEPCQGNSAGAPQAGRDAPRRVGEVGVRGCPAHSACLAGAAHEEEIARLSEIRPEDRSLDRPDLCQFLEVPGVKESALRAGRGPYGRSARGPGNR